MGSSGAALSVEASTTFSFHQLADPRVKQYIKDPKDIVTMDDGIDLSSVCLIEANFVKL